jgi:hypothetical protein
MTRFPRRFKMRILAVRAVVALATLFALVPIAVEAAPPLPSKMLFVGNSFTYYNAGINYHMQKMVESSGIDIGFAAAAFTIPSASLWSLWLTNDTLRSLNPGHLFGDANKFDAVVLQERAVLNEVGLFRKSVQLFTTAIRAQGGRPILFMPWPTGDPGDPDMTTIEREHRTIAKELNIEIAPVGLAMLEAKTRSDFNIFVADNHPSRFGTYLATCVIYAVAFGKSPVGNSYRGEFGGLPSIPEEDALYLQELAWQVVQSYQSP